MGITAESGGTLGPARVCLPMPPLAVSSVGVWPPKDLSFWFLVILCWTCAYLFSPPRDLHGSRAPTGLIIPS